MVGVTLVGALVVATVLGGAAHLLCDHGPATGFAVLGLWALFALFCLLFFRDPDPMATPPAGAYLSPAHGVVDIIDEVTEQEYIGGPCKRISIFLSIFDVHVQNAPIAGRTDYVRHHPGEFLNAMNLDSAARNENVMFGFTSQEAPHEKVGVRLIAGLIARRIVPWAREGELTAHGGRISLIQFGSRVTLYLPPSADIQVGLKQRVRGGVTVLATRGRTP